MYRAFVYIVDRILGAMLQTIEACDADIWRHPRRGLLLVLGTIFVVYVRELSSSLSEQLLLAGLSDDLHNVVNPDGHGLVDSIVVENPLNLLQGWCGSDGFTRARMIPTYGSPCVQVTGRRNRTGFEKAVEALSARGLGRLVSAEVEAAADAAPELVAVAGCARDVGPKLARTMLPILGALPALLAPAAVAFLVFENDSADDTAAKLISWIGGDARRAATARLHFARRLGGSRTERLALCRNTLLGEAHRISARYLLMLDLDCKRRPPWADDPRPLRMALGALRRREWDVLAANSMAELDYYDLWALRSAELGADYDCWRDRVEMKRRGDCDATQLRINASAPPFAVDSAFNGLALYRLGALRRRAGGCSYDGGRTCEHVPFHLCLRRSGLRLGVAPYLVQGCGDGAPRAVVGPPRVRVRVEGDGSVERREVREVGRDVIL